MFKSLLRLEPLVHTILNDHVMFQCETHSLNFHDHKLFHIYQLWLNLTPMGWMGRQL